MLRELFTVSVIFLASLFLVNSAFAKKVDRTVLYDKNKVYCNKPLQLSYSPPKDQYFCTHNPRNNYVHVDAKGNPYCKKPYILVFDSKASKIFKRTPTCVKKQVLNQLN